MRILHRTLGASVLTTFCLLPTAGLDGQSLCEQLHGLEPGESTREAVFSTSLHAGAGWHRGPAGFTTDGGGPFRELAVRADRTIAVRRCTPEGDYTTELPPHGLRIGVSGVEGYWSDFAAVSVHAGYLHTGSSLRFWIAPELSATGVSMDSLGLALGANAGVALFEWLAAQIRPAYLVGGRGSYADGFVLMAGVSISPTFRREHFSERD